MCPRDWLYVSFVAYNYSGPMIRATTDERVRLLSHTHTHTHTHTYTHRAMALLDGSKSNSEAATAKERMRQK